MIRVFLWTPVHFEVGEREEQVSLHYCYLGTEAQVSHPASVDTKKARLLIIAEWKWALQLFTSLPMTPPFCYFSLHSSYRHHGGWRQEGMILILLDDGGESLHSLAVLL